MKRFSLKKFTRNGRKIKIYRQDFVKNSKFMKVSTNVNQMILGNCEMVFKVKTFQEKLQTYKSTSSVFKIG